jgi:hypothetical protein
MNRPLARATPTRAPSQLREAQDLKVEAYFGPLGGQIDGPARAD